jgi:hypothetical protein
MPGGAGREAAMFTSCRIHKRYAIKTTATVFHNGWLFEFPIRDLSVAGIGLATPHTIDLPVGAMCFVALPRYGVLDAIVVGTGPRSYHLQFLAPDIEDRYLMLDIYFAGSAAVAPSRGPQARRLVRA